MMSWTAWADGMLLHACFPLNFAGFISRDLSCRPSSQARMHINARAVDDTLASSLALYCTQQALRWGLVPMLLCGHPAARA